jgi:outer membrane receptor protein involved in Fe transport
LWQTPEGYVDNRNVNIGKLTAKGVDLGVNYSRPLGPSGSLELDLLGSWLKSQTVDLGGIATPQECAGAYGFACGVPKPSWRHKARATWTIDEHYSFSLQWRHAGSVTLDRSIEGNLNLAGPWRPGDEKIGAQNYVDLTALVRSSKSYEIRFGIQNLFDRQPPIISSTGDFPEGTCPETVCNGNTFPQLYDPLGRYIFAGITMNLGSF